MTRRYCIEIMVIPINEDGDEFLELNEYPLIGPIYAHPDRDQVAAIAQRLAEQGNTWFAHIDGYSTILPKEEDTAHNAI